MSETKNVVRAKLRRTSQVIALPDPPIGIYENLTPPAKRRKFEDTHSRQTFYVQNDLIKKINKLAKKEKGVKTRIVNEALRLYIDHLLKSN
ncbi:hypothetical protein [Brevibacillus fulvus]|uniref:Uncharacterized protein n=1 Tax=Brevibacillus fulvus TaxID=1125967 RepID=A0A938Y4U1_9BACL|nr:hypothetical protein [Brevibacillus fulvus]MBM7592319.1 hypothetical protein [Brevibacillus fulvus]